MKEFNPSLITDSDLRNQYAEIVDGITENVAEGNDACSEKRKNGSVASKNGAPRQPVQKQGYSNGVNNDGKDGSVHTNGNGHHNGVDTYTETLKNSRNKAITDPTISLNRSNGYHHPVPTPQEELLDREPSPEITRQESQVKPAGYRKDQFLSKYLGKNRAAVYAIASADIQEVEQHVRPQSMAVICEEKLNNSRYFNKFLESINLKLVDEGVFAGFLETNEQRKQRILNSFPKALSYLCYPFDFLVKRTLPKFKLTRRLYFHLTKGKNRAMSLPEALGRLISCGFEVLNFEVIEGMTYIVAKKIKAPAYDDGATYGLLVRLNRIGKGGKFMSLYKLRTMHPYSEYLQDYVFRLNNLKDGGKFENDFRVTWWGSWLRRFWLDEQPMWINYFRGELKLVGVRPLSPQYFRLYPAWMQEYRTRFKPGLVPPFYADMPVSLEEIVESERRYLEQYEKRPFLTDFRYFFRSMFNIIFRNARSS